MFLCPGDSLILAPWVAETKFQRLTKTTRVAFDELRRRRMAMLASKLCYAALAAPVSNIMGLLIAIYTGQCGYPKFTISDVIRTSPGLNIVACGWTTFAASFAVLSHIQHELLSSLNIDALRPWILLRQYVSVALILLMSIIHLVPLHDGDPPWYQALHFGIAGSYASMGILEAWLLTRCIEPILRRERYLVGTGGSWLRLSMLIASPGWLIVALLGGLGMAFELPKTEAAASLLEFAIITLYGCYPLALRPLVVELLAASAVTNTGVSSRRPPRLAVAGAAPGVSGTRRRAVRSPGRVGRTPSTREAM